MDKERRIQFLQNFGKWLVMTFTLILLGTNAKAQFDLDLIEKEKLTPAGTKHLRDSLFLDIAEISNISWLEFLYYTERDSSESYNQSMQPDLAVWKDLVMPDILMSWFGFQSDSISKRNNLSLHYMRSLHCRHFPSVGVSFYQANEYCKWRSGAVNMFVNKSLENENKNYRVIYNYFLPAFEDLEYGSTELRQVKLPGKTGRIIRKLDPEYSQKRLYTTAATKYAIARSKEGKDIYVETANFLGDSGGNVSTKGFGNLIGNVSEMTDKEGISFGGAWIHTLDEIIAANKTFHYKKPELWLGFRCACTIEIIPLAGIR